LKQNSGLQKRKCNPRPGERAADLAGATLNAGESDCRIMRAGASQGDQNAIKNPIAGARASSCLIA